MHFFRVSSLKTQLLIIILLAMLVPAAAMLYDIFIATKTDDVLINETEQKLIQITNLINEQMQREINISDEIRCATLSDIFNSVVVPLIEHYPGVRICLYERETDNIIIYGHLHEFGARLPEEKKNVKGVSITKLRLVSPPFCPVAHPLPDWVKLMTTDFWNTWYL